MASDTTGASRSLSLREAVEQVVGVFSEHRRVSPSINVEGHWFTACSCGWRADEPGDFLTRWCAHRDDLIARVLDAVPDVPPDPPAADREAITRVLIGHQAAWVDDREARVGYYGFYECGCNEHGHLNGLLLTQDDVARHQADEVAGVLVDAADVRARAQEAAWDEGYQACCGAGDLAGDYNPYRDRAVSEREGTTS